jgi:hypothetical protein
MGSGSRIIRPERVSIRRLRETEADGRPNKKAVRDRTTFKAHDCKRPG